MKEEKLMPFTIEDDSLIIRGRRGDTASFTFNFEQDISAYTVHFYVKKNISDKDAVIEKIYTNQGNKTVIVNLNTEDTEKLSALPNSYTTYFWGLKINIGSEFAQTLRLKFQMQHFLPITQVALLIRTFLSSSMKNL